MICIWQVAAGTEAGWRRAAPALRFTYAGLVAAVRAFLTAGSS